MALVLNPHIERVSTAAGAGELGGTLLESGALFCFDVCFGLNASEISLNG